METHRRLSQYVLIFTLLFVIISLVGFYFIMLRNDNKTPMRARLVNVNLEQIIDS